MKSHWYDNGLHFECQGCGKCCSGPEEGYIWVTKAEIELIADFLKITIGQCRRDYIRRVGLRSTIIEQEVSKDCIFLRNLNGKKQCIIYPVRPSQCRIWPFWSDNLSSPDSWNKTAKICPGINRGRCYSVEDIKEIRSNKKWWLSKEQIKNS